MRSLVFRVLAGVVAVGIGWLLLVADGGQRPAHEVFRFGSVGAIFGLFALFGPAPAERLMGHLFGVGGRPTSPAPPT